MVISADVEIVGAGPIGLANAWGLKKPNPDLKVVVIEKYSEYQRKHSLIMQHQQLEKLMLATGSEHDEQLCALLARLKKDPHIRTNELESIFKQLALDNGVEIIIEEVQQSTIETQLLGCKPKLIIGADGTHSVVNQSFFPEGNQVKHEFDSLVIDVKSC